MRWKWILLFFLAICPPSGSAKTNLSSLRSSECVGRLKLTYTPSAERLSFFANRINSEPNFKKFKRDKNVLYYSGTIEDGDCEAFKKNMDKVSLLVVNSVGGDINEGICMGNQVFAKRMDVKVYGACLSSCANYIFASGKNKTIHGIVGFHGNAKWTWARDYNSTFNSMREKMEKEKLDKKTIEANFFSANESVEKMIKTEDELLSKLGIRDDLFRLSARFSRGSALPDYFEYLVPEIETLKRYGFRNISGTQDFCLIKEYNTSAVSY